MACFYIRLRLVLAQTLCLSSIKMKMQFCTCAVVWKSFASPNFYTVFRLPVLLFLICFKITTNTSILCYRGLFSFENQHLQMVQSYFYIGSGSLTWTSRRNDELCVIVGLRLTVHSATHWHEITSIYDRKPSQSYSGLEKDRFVCHWCISILWASPCS